MNEILTKSLIYRMIAIFLDFLIPYIMIEVFGWKFWTLIGLLSTIVAFISYALYEVIWRKYEKRRKLKAGLHLFLIKNGVDKHGWYNVVKTLEDNKFVIEVI